mgnify:CR=1 FL=1
MSDKSSALANWNRAVKPNARDFNTFRDNATWNEIKDNFLSTLKHQNLAHLVDATHVIVDSEHDEAQREFLHKAITDQFLHRKAKQIV